MRGKSMAGITLGALALLDVGCSGQGVNLQTLGAAGQAASAVTFSDDDARAMAKQAAQQADQTNPVAPPDNPYAKRLQKVIGGHTQEGATTLNYKVYLVEDINAFAMADGTVRVYAGLMDIMTDDELRFVIGHEIGHVVEGHTAEKMRLAYTTTAARSGLAAAGGTAGQLAASQVGDITEALIHAQFSQSEESEADQYGLSFMKKNGYPTKAAPAALRKLAKAGGGAHDPFFSSHPDPMDRAAALEKQL